MVNIEVYILLFLHCIQILNMNTTEQCLYSNATQMQEQVGNMLHVGSSYRTSIMHKRFTKLSTVHVTYMSTTKQLPECWK